MKISKAYPEMLPTANWLYEELQPYFERLEICGSIRRKKDVIGDIEYIGISKKVDLNGQSTLFGNPDIQHHPDLLSYIRKYEVIKGNKPQGKLTSFVLPAGIQVDLFFANQENWGYIQTLRTGSGDFNQFYLLPRLKNKGYSLHDGHIWYDNTVVSIPDEETLFQLLNMKVIPPELRFKIGNQAKYYGFKSAR